jgi:protein required for attachment to host cells
LLKPLAKDQTPVILIAPTHMLGDIFSHQDAVMHRRILAKIDKDMTHQNTPEIARFLRAYRS